MRLGILGAGNVGDSVAYVALSQGLARQILINDINQTRAKSVVADVNDARGFVVGFSECVLASLEELATCDIIVISTGKIVANADRLAELEYNKAQMLATVPAIMKAGFNGKFIVISNPCDIISYLVFKLSGLPYQSVIGTGTGLDSARLSLCLADKLNLATKSVNAVVLGEHGDSQFAAFSQSFIGQQRLDEYLAQSGAKLDLDAIEDEARQRGHEICAGKGCTQYGIANTANRLIRALKDDSDEIFCVSTLMQGEYGLEGLYVSTPCKIGADGVKEKIALSLNEAERKKLAHSAQIIKAKIAQLGL
ncbi:lactate/malate family dehydrogenase [Campylobacter sp. 19-13652]|uniref:lactate/malate family dehydrogenase n=1 Tax=Campylobacter sp. 19-13652 TaxID=2840180 RepID=UPI001C7479B2|nr:NAD(P)-binding domain-containing protein [Campylobacter sp. 19-13652]BCX80259.1 L-lactate dehydrogenase 2 [Campylobacter sp. 19-13652]